MFLMFDRAVWEKLGRPYLSKRETSDPAQEVTRRAIEYARVIRKPVTE